MKYERNVWFAMNAAVWHALTVVAIFGLCGLTVYYRYISTGMLEEELHVWS